jgi:transposase InsO family protein
VVEQLSVSERRACRVLRQSRATQRYLPDVRDDEEPLTGRIIEIAAVYGRYGTPRVRNALKSEGWHVNHKRVERIWRREGLKVPKKQPRRGRLWLNDGSCIRLRAQRRDHVWAYDFGSPASCVDARRCSTDATAR